VALAEGAYGAVENPGLITFVQRSLLLTPGQATPRRRRMLRGLIAHELAHQWFGDLVTQADWQDVWLSEGFATWLSGRMIDEEEPPARKSVDAIVARERIMAVDAGPNTRPVRVAMRSVAAMKDVYSRIVYQKGAAVLLMLDGWLGEDRVRDGLRLYLKQHEFGIATTVDLAEALRAASRTDPTAVLHSFLDQAGIPVVRAQIECAPGAPARVLIEQTNSSAQWTIPVCWKADGGGSGCEVLDQLRREIALAKGSSCPTWIYPNAGGTGYYRIEWTAPQLAALAAHGLGQLTAAERLTLVYDLRALHPPGAQTMLNGLAKDPDPDVAQAAGQK
jgi:alanyl aminopeptidase